MTGGALHKENVNFPPGVGDGAGGWRNLDYYHSGEQPSREYPSGAADVAEVERVRVISAEQWLGMTSGLAPQKNMKQ